MAISNGGEIGGAGSKTIDAPSPGGDIIGGYIRVSPTNIESFTISTNVGILTQADFILTGTYYEYYNANLISIQSASSTGYTAVINKTISHGDLIFEVAFHLTRLYAWTDPNPMGTTSLYAWTCADNNETRYTKTSTLAYNTPLYDKDSEAIGSISGFIIDDNKFSSDISYTFTNAETLSILTSLYNDELITTQADSLEDFIAAILGLESGDISLNNLHFVFSEVYTDSMGSNITSDLNGINVDPGYYFLVDDTTSSNDLALFLFLGTERVFFIGYFDNTKIDPSNYNSQEVRDAIAEFRLRTIRTQMDFHRIFLDTQTGDIATGYLGVEVTDETLYSESGSLDILAGDKGNTLLYCFDANSPWTDGVDSFGTTAFAESSGDFGELTSDSSIRITSISWKGLNSIFDLIEASDSFSYDRDSNKDIIEYDTSETLYAWTCDQDGIYVGPNQVHTIYTKTNTIDTSTDIFYLEDGTEISLSELIYGSTIGDSIISADANRIQIDFAT